MGLALQGVLILDWTIWQQGPVATAFLGDLGADVIKIEERGVGDPARGLRRVRGLDTGLPQGKNFYFEYNNRNKRSVTIDIKKQRGREIIYRLVKNCDVFVQNFRPGVATRLGLDYKTLSKYNERLIYASASGFGPKGPDSHDPAFDYLGLARSGIMFAADSEPDMAPQYIRGAIADQMGAIMLAFGVTVALLVREMQGIGQELDVSLLSSMMSLQGMHMAAVTLLGKELPHQTRAVAPNPLFNHYRCKDGKWLTLSHVQSDRYWCRFCQAISRQDLKKDPLFVDSLAREKNAVELVAILDEVFATKTCGQWIRTLREKGDFICCAINSPLELLTDPQVIANEYIREWDHPVLGRIKLPSFPIQFGKCETSFRLPAPELGQHTEEVLMEIGHYSWDKIQELHQEEVI